MKVDRVESEKPCPDCGGTLVHAGECQRVSRPVSARELALEAACRETAQTLNRRAHTLTTQLALELARDLLTALALEPGR